MDARAQPQLMERAVASRPARLLALALALFSLAAAAGPDDAVPAGCRLEAGHPLRLEVEQLIAQGAAFTAQQRELLQDKVARLGQAKGWSSADQDAYFREVVLTGNEQSWQRTLEIAAAFVSLCQSQTEEDPRAEAVRTFREFYAVERAQWRAIHDRVDRDLAEAGAPAQP